MTATTLFGTGCASLVAQPRMVAVDLGRPELQGFDVVRTRTSFERDAQLERRDDQGAGGRAITPPLFWSGIVLGTLGAVGTIGFAAAGRVAKDRLNAMYAEGSGTQVDRDQIRDRGDVWNGLTVASSVLMAVGYAVSIITYGVDWNRCGPLAPSKRRCPPK